MTSLGGIKLEEIERASKKIGVNIIDNVKYFVDFSLDRIIKKG